MKKELLSLFFLLQFGGLFSQENFSFVFLPDLHLRPDPEVEASFGKVVKQVNIIHPGFIITG